ncbi:hypothetical protein ACP70R_039804 [Stipagrostis hirtigluma subsp. patula]
MGRKVRWFDSVQKILSTSEPSPEEKEAKAAKSREKSSFKKIWSFSKSSSSGGSTSATPAPAPEAHEQAPSTPPQSQHDQQQVEEITEVQVQSVETRNKQQVDEITEESSTAETAATVAAQAAPAAAHSTATTPRARLPRSREDLAAIRIQTACRSYLARRALRARGMARLTSLVEGPAVKRQTEEALYCMQTMTRIQTQTYTRRLRTEDDKKALKCQIKVKQTIDKKKISEGWDHSHQSKEQMEAVLTMKQEAASRRQKALAYAFSNQWKNRKPSSARAAPPPKFMDPGNPNWGWTWTERWMAAATPWESQTAPQPGSGRAGRRPRVAISVQAPTTPTGKSFRRPSWPSLPSSSTPPPRSPSVSGRTAVPASPRSSALQATSGLQRTTSMQSERRPRSSQDPPVNSPRRAAAPTSPRGSGSPLHASSGLQRTASMQSERRAIRSIQDPPVSSPRRSAVPASPRGGGSPLHASSGLQPRTMSMGYSDRRPRSSQERSVSSPRHGDANAKDAAPLRRTSSLRSETPRRLSLGGASTAGAGDDGSAPVTPSYMQATKSVKAKARPPSPSAAAAEKLDAPERTPRMSSPSSGLRRLSLAPADKPSASSPSPSKAKAESVRRQSQPPSPRTPRA